jgi:hypothetical protein
VADIAETSIRLAAQPDITLTELRVWLARQKVLVGKSSITRFLNDLDLTIISIITFKKSLHAAEQDRPDGGAQSMAPNAS